MFITSLTTVKDYKLLVFPPKLHNILLHTLNSWWFNRLRWSKLWHWFCNDSLVSRRDDDVYIFRKYLLLLNSRCISTFIFLRIAPTFSSCKHANTFVIHLKSEKLRGLSPSTGGLISQILMLLLEVGVFHQRVKCSRQRRETRRPSPTCSSRSRRQVVRAHALHAHRWKHKL